VIASSWVYALLSESNGESVCRSIAIDSKDNIYIVGSIIGTNSYFFAGNEITGLFPNGDNFFIAKIGPDGRIAWIKTSQSDTCLSSYTAVAVDSNDQILVIGYYYGYTDFNISDSIALPGENHKQAIFAKYDENGEMIWAQTVADNSYTMNFNDIAIDDGGNIYIVGQIRGSGPYSFGNEVEVSYVSGGSHVLIAKYDEQGVAQWARTVASSNVESCFNSVSVDHNGDAYAVGYLSGSGTCILQDGISCSYGQYPKSNILAAKYSTEGNVEWAMPEEMDNSYSSSYGSSYSSTCTLSNDRTILLGNLYGTNSYSLGSGHTISGDSMLFNGLAVFIDGEKDFVTGLCGGFGSDAIATYNDVTTNKKNDVYILGSIDYCIWLETPMNQLGLIIKTDTDGNPKWVKAYTGSSYVTFKGAVVNSLDEIFVIGQSFENSNTAFIAKLE
jgi:hypothetical protein